MDFGDDAGGAVPATSPDGGASGGEVDGFVTVPGDGGRGAAVAAADGASGAGGGKAADDGDGEPAAPDKRMAWRAEREAALEAKRAEEDVARKKKRRQAEAELEEFYETRTTRKQEDMSKNRDSEKAGADERAALIETAATNPWERVASLVDTSAAGTSTAPTKGESGDEVAARRVKDVSRLREILVRLKSEPPTSGAAAGAGSS